MRAPAPLAIGLIGMLVLAGCVGPDGGSSSADPKKLLGGNKVQRLNIGTEWAEHALVGHSKEDHKKGELHQNLSTANFHQLGYDPLITDYYGRTAGDYACGDSREKDGKRISVVHSFGTDIAFVIIDVTDALKPQKIGEVVMANTQVYDLALAPNLKYVILATSPMDAVPSPPQGVPPIDGRVQYGTFRDACTGQETPIMGPETGLPYHSGNVLVDISNPRAPNVVDFLFFPVLGAHSITITDVKGKMIGLSSVPNVPASYYVFMEISEIAGRGKLVPLSIYRYSANSAPQSQVLGASMHDGIIAKHPGTGKYVAYLAFGSTGLVILDVENPADPQFLSRWADYGKVGDSRPGQPYVHEALPAPDLWEGRHYVWIGEECISHPSKTPTCLIFGLDDTDPKNPQFVGAWTLPVDVQWTRGLEYSLHYLALVNRTLFASVYHGGVWAIDVSTEEARWSMPSVGVFMPSNVSPKRFETPPRTPVVQQLYGSYALDGAPTVLDLNALDDGTLVVFDLQSGVYTVRFDDQMLAPSPMPWPMGHLTAAPK